MCYLYISTCVHLLCTAAGLEQTHISDITACVINFRLIGYRPWLSFSDMLVVLRAIRGHSGECESLWWLCTCSLCLTFMNISNLQHLDPHLSRIHTHKETHKGIWTGHLEQVWVSKCFFSLIMEKRANKKASSGVRSLIQCRYDNVKGIIASQYWYRYLGIYKKYILAFFVSLWNKHIAWYGTLQFAFSNICDQDKYKVWHFTVKYINLAVLSGVMVPLFLKPNSETQSPFWYICSKLILDNTSP